MSDSGSANQGAVSLGYLISVSGLVVTALGLLVLTGWWLGFTPAQVMFLESIAMRADTAIGLAAIGLALVAFDLSIDRRDTRGRDSTPATDDGTSPPDRRARYLERLASTLAIGAAILGLASLLQYLLGTGSGLHELWAEAEANTGDHPASDAGGMPTSTALGFALLGGAFIGVQLRAPRLSQTLSIAVILLAAMTLASRLYQLGFSDIGITTPVGLHTSFGFLAAGLGALFLRSDVGLPAILLDASEAGRQVRLMFPVALVVPFALGTLSIAGGRAELWSPEYNVVVLVLTATLALSAFALLSYWSVKRSDTDRLAALASLTTSEEAYRRTFEHATIGIAHLAPDGRWIRVNQRLCEILGYEEAELLEMTYAEVSHLDDLEIDVLQWELLRRGEISDYGVERRFLTKAGEVVVADVRLVREEGATHRSDHFIAVLQDITGRKLSEGTLRVYQRALEATQNGIVIADASQEDQPIIYTNPAFLDMSGYESADVIGRNCRFLNERARDQTALEVIREALDTGTECSVLLRNHRKDATPFWNQLSLAPVHDEQSKLTHYVGVAIDVTQQVETAGEREELLLAAEKAGQEKNRFLSVVSHEMRSPMNAVLAWASILRDEPTSETVGRASQAIEASILAQSRLVDDLLEMSRVRAGTLEIQPLEIDFVAAARKVVDQLRPVADDKGIELELEEATEVVPGWADPARLEQVLRNLIENALKFTPREGHIEVEVEGGENGVAIDVKDSGRGIERDALPRLFDEFWQGRGEAGSGSQGLGLGLSIVKHLVEIQGGTISAESMGAGCGSTFRVRMPRREGESAAVDPESARPGPATNSEPADTAAENDVPVPGDGAKDGGSESSGEVLPQDRTETSPGAVDTAPLPTGRPSVRDAPDLGVLAGLEVVVVDDDVPTVEAASLAFVQAGSVVHEAYSVAEALRHFEQSTPDILISDIGLPDRNGMDLIRAVRALPAPKNAVLAIAVTGIADALERRRIQRAGFDGYLSKPIAPSVILERSAQLILLNQTPTLPRRRVLFAAAEGFHADTGMVGRLEALGYDLRQAQTTEEAMRLIAVYDPELIFLSAQLPEAESLARRSRSQSSKVVLVALVRDDDPIELSEFDHVLAVPAPPKELRRLLNTIEVAKWRN